MALATLADIANSKNAAPAARVSACNAILDRAYGRPRQALEHSGPDGADLPAGIMIALVKPGEADE